MCPRVTQKEGKRNKGKDAKPCRMKLQAFHHDHNIEQKAHSHDHKVCVIRAIEYAMPIALQ